MLPSRVVRALPARIDCSQKRCQRSCCSWCPSGVPWSYLYISSCSPDILLSASAWNFVDTGFYFRRLSVLCWRKLVLKGLSARRNGTFEWCYFSSRDGKNFEWDLRYMVILRQNFGGRMFGRWLCRSLRCSSFPVGPGWWSGRVSCWCSRWWFSTENRSSLVLFLWSGVLRRGSPGSTHWRHVVRAVNWIEK